MKKVVYIIIVLWLWGCNSSPKKQSESAKVDSTEVVSQVHFPEWSNDAVIYEVNVRQYTPEGTFEAFSEHLPRLKELGVEILWFMPIYPISEKNRKGTLGSYYAISDYTGVNPEFGTFDDFKQLVDEAHSMGFKVLLDWVANHTGWDGPWIENHPEWFTHDSLGNIVSPVADWTDVADLNYDNTQMRAAMIDAMQYWVAEANIDGFRCDVAGMVPVDFWNDARAALDSIKPVFMLAEDEAEYELLHKAFNINYGWEFHHIMNSIAQGEADANAVAEYYTKVDSVYPKGSYMMHFTSNHDENSWNGTVYERMGDAVKTMAALSFTLPGMPLIYSGQEAGNNKRLEFFEKDEIDWSKLEMQQFYAKLIDLKQQNKALWNGCEGGDIQFIDVHEDILVFIRAYKQNKVLAVFNLSGSALDISTIPDEICGTYTNEKSQLQDTITQNKPVNLSAWEYKIFTSR